MTDSLFINQRLVERSLARLRLFGKICSEAEWKTIANVVEFLMISKPATQVLSGSKYPTISLVLLFRAEIVAALQDIPTDCAMVMFMKQRMRQALNRRLLVTELNIIRALLDPSQCNLTVVEDCLVAQDTTAFHLLSQAMDKSTGVQQLQANNTLSGMHEAASTSKPVQYLVPLKKANKTCCRNMSILQAQVIQKVRCIDACRLHSMMFWLGGNHKKISTPGCDCSPKQYWPFQLPVPHQKEFFPQRD